MPRCIETEGYVQRFGMGLTLEGHEMTEGLQRDQMEVSGDCHRVQTDSQQP